MSGGGERVGLGRAAVAVAAGVVVAWALSVGFWYFVISLVAGDPPAIIAASPGDSPPPVSLLRRVLPWWAIDAGAGVLGIFLASLAGGALVCALVRRGGCGLLFGPAVAVPGLLFMILALMDPGWIAVAVPVAVAASLLGVAVGRWLVLGR